MPEALALKRFRQSRWPATRWCRTWWWPRLDQGEVTDKGSINQRAVLQHRAHLVEQLFAAEPGPDVFVPG